MVQLLQKYQGCMGKCIFPTIFMEIEKCDAEPGKRRKSKVWKRGFLQKAARGAKAGRREQKRQTACLMKDTLLPVPGTDNEENRSVQKLSKHGIKEAKPTGKRAVGGKKTATKAISQGQQPSPSVPIPTNHRGGIQVTLRVLTLCLSLNSIRALRS